MASEGSPWKLQLQPPLRLLVVVLLCLVSSSPQVVTSSDADVLLRFKDTMKDKGAALRDWVADSSPCLGAHKANWTGVACSGTGAVFKLLLENMNLSGTLNTDVLVGLTELRSLSFMNNSFEGPMPDVGKFRALRGIYLSLNKFSGEIPHDAFAGMGSLKFVYLSHNNFSGPIPTSLARLPKLVELRLEENKFDGGIPDLPQPDLKLVNVSYNNLDGGCVPDSLRKMGASSFVGNKGHVDFACTSSTPPPLPPPPSSKKPSAPLRIAIVVIGLGVVLAIVGTIFAVLRRRRDEEPQLGRPPSSKTSKKVAYLEVDHLEQGPPVNYSGGSGKKGAGSAAKENHDQQGGLRLVFVKEDRERFELQDLLRASAEVLGSGGFGSSYKAVLLSGPAMVVKRFKEMNGVGKEDFQEHMRRLGRLSHLNLLPLVAYYYRKEEKLLVTDHIANGSLAHLLHGNRGGSNHPKLDWATRLKIVKGVARGLAYLYNELPMMTLPHGHLKSSNVLLDDTFEPLLTDYALSPVMNPTHASQLMAAYKSPEYDQHRRTTKKSDVWSLGILILEVLTGKYPAGNYLPRQQLSGGDTDLTSWVNSVVKEEWTGEVFDGGMMGGTTPPTKNARGEGEMLKLFQIGLGCCEADVGKRWELAEAVERIEQLKERESGDEDHSSNSYASEGEVYYSSSTRATTDVDELSLPPRTNEKQYY